MELRFTVIIFLTCIHASFTQGMQQFDREPQYTEANPGDTIVMQCRVFNKKGQCVWQKDGKPVGMYPGKYEWVSSPDLGDCSIRISAARADFDAGEWECQVTASSFDAQDALTSDPAWLVIRVAPSPPQIEVDLTNVNSNSNFTVVAGKAVTVRCISRGGNPAANLKWFLGNRELTQHNQTNVTDIGKYKTWMAISTLTYTFNKSDHLNTLKCVAIHEAYPTKSRDLPVTLDVHYPPEVSLAGSPSLDLEENIDSASFRCNVDANPPATVIWRRVGGSSPHNSATNDIYSFQEVLEFSPVTRRDSATYSCEAKNAIGTSNLVTLPLDVKYAPTIVSVGPAVGQQLTVSLYESVRLECQAEGNPVPRYRWIHRRLQDGEETEIFRSEDRFLPLSNVTYEDQGEYFCSASNIINDQEKTVNSETITVRVVGPPQMLREVSSRFVSVERGDDAIIRAVFCADPRPIRVSWRWASFQLEAGSGSGRFVAEALHKVTPTPFVYMPPTIDIVESTEFLEEAPTTVTSEPLQSVIFTAPPVNSSSPSHHEALPVAETLVAPQVKRIPSPARFAYSGKRDECYETRLRIQRVEMNDARHYYLTVENDKGSDSFYVTLTVKEPVSMATVIAVVIACLFLIIVVTLCLLYAYRSERCCFNRNSGSKSTDLESMKSDVESVHSSQCSSGSSMSNVTNASTNGNNKQHRSSKNNSSVSHVSIVESDPAVKLLRPSSGPFRTNIFIPGPVVVTKITNPFVNAGVQETAESMEIPFNPHITTVEKNPADYRGLLYADLQLPKISNNGSMKLKSSQWPLNRSQLSDRSLDQTIDTLDTTLDRSHLKVDV